MPTPLYNECMALVANAYAGRYALRSWYALEFYMQVTQPGMPWNLIINDWVATN